MWALGQSWNPHLSYDSYFRPQHLSGLKLIADICKGNLKGGNVKSTEIAFKPGDITAGSYLADTKTAGYVHIHIYQIYCFSLLKKIANHWATTYMCCLYIRASSPKS